MLQELLPVTHCWMYQSLTAALPTAVSDVLLFCEHFMARHILCFHITDKFVLSLSHWPLLDSLNDVVQLRELTLLQRATAEGAGAVSARMCTDIVRPCDTHISKGYACLH